MSHWGCVLKGSRIVLAAVLAAFAAIATKADGIDPTVIVRRVDPTPIAILSPSQIFDITATSKKNIFAFQNDTGITLDSLTLDLFGVNANLLFSCGSFAGGNIFADCSSSAGSHGDTIISFSGVGGDFTGITPATCGWVDKGKGDDDDNDKDHNRDDKFTCTGGVYSLEFGGIPKGDKVAGTGTFLTPEPVTSVMLLSGLAGLLGLRKRRAS